MAAKVSRVLTSNRVGSGIIMAGNPGGIEPTIFTPKLVRLEYVISTIDPKTRNNVLGSLGNFLVAKIRKEFHQYQLQGLPS